MLESQYSHLIIHEMCYSLASHRPLFIHWVNFGKITEHIY